MQMWPKIVKIDPCGMKWIEARMPSGNLTFKVTSYSQCQIKDKRRKDIKSGMSGLNQKRVVYVYAFHISKVSSVLHFQMGYHSNVSNKQAGVLIAFEVYFILEHSQVFVYCSPIPGTRKERN